MAATTAAPHPRIAELLAELEHSRRDLLEVVNGLPANQRDATPTGGVWCVAQILEHLCIVEDGGGRLVTKLMRQAQQNGAFETESSSLLHSLDQFDITSARHRIEAPPPVTPTAGMTTSQALERLQSIRERFVTTLLEASGLALSTVSHPHPIFGPLNGYQWILFIALHERRHIAQIHRQNGLAAS